MRPVQGHVVVQWLPAELLDQLGVGPVESRDEEIGVASLVVAAPAE